ncbi:nuclear transport factor 2 family protein [Vibrio sp. SCSIO 43137]|uniref:nuclear transport factor 2 family protein n=1 Tax=Vibrio sp. SCSIO 43137 TaxID=3021011 RepID=UPI002308086B|nr:nuclear transport factor 2 family protein [Vibrio sp. SCSIO 43137]WCE31833.1 nuclear transport factor 2 family protein [Vibrio sp. SCSIO 43137]
MKFRKYIAVLATLLVSFSAFSASTEGTEKVWQEHINAWVDRDLDAIAVHYDKDSMMIVNNVVFRGPQEIRKVFEYLFHRFDNGSNAIDPAIVDDRTIYITWNFTPSEKKDAIYGTDTFFVEDGIIKVQTIASKLYQKPTLLILGGKEQG